MSFPTAQTTGQAPRVLVMIESSRASGRAFLRGVAEYARLQGHWTFYWEPAGLEEDTPAWESLAVDGVILRDVGPVEAILERGLPTVVVGHAREEIASVEGVINVVTDSAGAARLAAEHLLGCGLQHFGFCGLGRSGIETTPWSRERCQVFTDLVTRAGGDCQVFEIRRSLHSRRWQREFQRLVAWLQRLPHPLGVMACNDDCGQQVIEACRWAGLRVPENVAVIGVDNDELIAGLTNPPMSSVLLNFHQAGLGAAEKLDSMMRGGPRANQRIVVPATHVVARQSTNLLAVADQHVARALQFIRREAARPLSVEEVARSVGLSRRALEKRFRTALDRSVYAEIRRVRTDLIARLLVETHLPIARIAEQLGFEGPQHIARFFRAEKALSPREFRRRNQLGG